jgi:hypothetical protein
MPHATLLPRGSFDSARLAAKEKVDPPLASLRMTDFNCDTLILSQRSPLETPFKRPHGTHR